jgi:hypothetical protein
MATRFSIRIGSRSAPLLRVAFGVTRDSAWAEIDEDQVLIRFGRFEFRAPMDNIARWRIEGPWRWVTAVGIRRSQRHGDITFSGSHRGGVRLDLRSPQGWYRLRVPAVYAGVDDLEGFAAELSRLGIPGEDARLPRA